MVNFFSALLLISAVFKRQDTGLSFISTPSSVVSTGDIVDLEWTSANSTEPVTISLLQGPSNNLETVEVLTTSATDGQFLWTVGSEISSGTDYTLQIEQGVDVNYSPQFAINGGSSTDESSGSGSATTDGASSGTTGAISSETSVASSGTSQVSSDTPTSNPAPVITEVTSTTPTAAASSPTSSSSSSSSSTTTVSSDSSSRTISSTSTSTTSSTRSSSTSITTTSSPLPSRSPSPTPQPTPPSGLSTGAKAAIGVCVPVGVIALVAAAFLLGRRASAKKKAGVEGEQQAAPAPQTAEYPKYASELGTNAPNELWTQGNAAEMEGTRHARPHELPGSPV